MLFTFPSCRLGTILTISLFLTAQFAGQTQQKNKLQAKPSQPHILLILPDSDCTLEVDGDPNTNQPLSANTPVRLAIALGEHLLVCSVNGVINSQELVVTATDPPQKIVHFALAEKIAQQDQERRRQEDLQQETNRRADKLAEDALKVQKQILENEDKMSGKWLCTEDTSLLPMDGRVYAYNGAAPSAGRVLEAYDKSIQIDFDGVSVDAKVASGNVKISTSARLATQYELNGYRGTERATIGMWQPACFNVNHNGCATTYSTVWRYDLDSVKEGDKDNVVLLLASGRCTGLCPDDRTSSSGRTIRIAFTEEHPGFKIDGTYCRKR